VIARHVFEHLPAPLAFLQRTSVAASAKGRSLPIYIEVPCIDRALETRRTVDFFYEHYSQFTTRSFLTMLERASATALEHGHGYDGEVVYAFARLGGAASELANEAVDFFSKTAASREPISASLRALSGKRVAVWGGTGKSAAFLARYGTGAEVVVDSDPRKVGTFVPGTSQLIRDPDELLHAPPDVVVIPPQWRARDIVMEMRRRGVRCERVLIEHDGSLVDYERGDHPYAKP